jgi:hypothetical protein
MGRGQKWGLQGTTHLASAMVQGTEDLVTGVEVIGLCRKYLQRFPVQGPVLKAGHLP